MSRLFGVRIVGPNAGTGTDTERTARSNLALLTACNSHYVLKEGKIDVQARVE
jgi:hypothetical protein